MTRQEKEELLEKFLLFILEENEEMPNAIRLFLDWEEQPNEHDPSFKERDKKLSLLNIEEEL